MAISATIPAISHVAVTVTDLSVSEAWYTSGGVRPDRVDQGQRIAVGADGGFGLRGPQQVRQASAPAPDRSRWWPIRADEAPSWISRRAVQAPARRQGEHLHHGRRVTALPAAPGDRDAVHRHGEPAEQRDVDARRTRSVS